MGCLLLPCQVPSKVHAKPLRGGVGHILGPAPRSQANQKSLTAGRSNPTGMSRAPPPPTPTARPPTAHPHINHKPKPRHAQHLAPHTQTTHPNYCAGASLSGGVKAHFLGGSEWHNPHANETLWCQGRGNRSANRQWFGRSRRNRPPRHRRPIQPSDLCLQVVGSAVTTGPHCLGFPRLQDALIA